MDKIIKDLKARQKALSKQSKLLQGKSGCAEEDIWEAEVNAKLDLVEELLDEYG